MGNWNKKDYGQDKFETAELVEIIHSIDPKALVIADEGVSVMSGNFEKRL